MPSSTTLKLFAFSTHTFDSPEEATALVALMQDAPFGVTRFGSGEPVKESLAGRGSKGAVDLLKGDGDVPGGRVLLAGDDPASTFVFVWGHGRPTLWYGEIASRWVKRPAQCNALVAGLERLFTRFPARYAAAAPAADWEARHWRTEALEGGGEVEKKVGLDLRSHLPGIYWWTLFGPEATAYFRRQKLLSAPAVQAADLGAGGVALRTSTCPLPSPSGQPSAAETALRDALGSDHFFDIGNSRQPSPGVPGVTSGGG